MDTNNSEQTFSASDANNFLNHFLAFPGSKYYGSGTSVRGQHKMQMENHRFFSPELRSFFESLFIRVVMFRFALFQSFTH